MEKLIKKRSIMTGDGRFFEVGTIVSHFKRYMIPKCDRERNYLYVILDFGYDCDTLEPVVIYQALYDNNLVFVRKEDDFLGEVDHIKYPTSDQEFKFNVFY